jgi:hypothetical protein
MHIGSTDAQAFAASTLQGIVDARARAKTEATRSERLALRRLAQNGENPELAVQGAFEGDEDDEEQERGDGGQESHGGSLNAKA